MVEANRDMAALLHQHALDRAGLGVAIDGSGQKVFAN
jgi:hypothetical protein